MKENSRKLVVVLGMHRSGTSALTRGLRVLHVAMGDRLIPGQVGLNDLGYWEDADINAFNERLLERLSSSWHGLTHLDEEKLTAPELDDLRAEARILLEEKLAEHAHFGFKDPRTAILLPFWQPIFSQLKLDDSYLIALRNPLDVAASLQKRDAIPSIESFLLWAKYIIAALRYSKGKQRVLVSYDALLETPEEQLKKIAESLELQSDFEQTSELRKYTEEFLSKDLRHSKSSLAALNQSPNVPPFVHQAYDCLQKVTKGRMGLDSSAFAKVWASIEHDYLKMEPLYSHIDLLNIHNAASRRELEQNEMEREAMQKELLKVNALAEHASREREQALIDRGYMEAQKDRAEQERSDALGELHRIQGELKGVMAERDTTKVERDQAITQREEAVQRQQNLQQEVQLLQRQFAQESTRCKQKDVELGLVYSSKSWRMTRPLRAFRRTVFTQIYRHFRRYLSSFLRAIWHSLPGSLSRKQRLKETLFRAMPTFLGSTHAYRTWVEYERLQARNSSIVASRHKKVEMTAEDRYKSMRSRATPLKGQFSARLIAYYLPQFHPIKENDLWWGKGFTEWTNTAKARPLFPGHEIPSVPSDLGYYDLRVPELRHDQAELAQKYGIEGFCYWHYWFGNGKRLLERPFNEVLKSGEPDIPFCLAWANHTWSGIWHGCPDRVLIEQTYPGLDDIKAHFYALLDAFLDPRYLKIDGRNVFSVYRPTDLQDAKLFIDTWRELAEKEGAPGFYFIAIIDYPWDKPQDGYDAFTTNPPVGMLPYQGVASINKEIEATLSPDRENSALPQIYAYDTFVENAFPEVTRQDDLFPCVVPKWDNTPRSGSNGFALHGSTPELYEKHLREAVDLVSDRSPDQRVVFVKSWNEWAETNYLEPDMKWGNAYLEKTREVIEEKVIK